MDGITPPAKSIRMAELLLGRIHPIPTSVKMAMFMSSLLGDPTSSSVHRKAFDWRYRLCIPQFSAKIASPIELLSK
jgi:hypothetical protein